MSDFIELVNVKKYYLAEKLGIIEALFRKKPVYVKALDDVSLSLKGGKILSVVGESGSGKTTLGKIISTLEKPTAGEVLFEGDPISDSNVPKIRKEVSMVFQNPATSVNPRMKIKDLVAEPLGHFVKDDVVEVLNSVGLDYQEYGDRQPRELSGGQVQRVALARAIIKRPRLLILDEPTSALDESVQAQILNLLIEIQRKYNLTYIFITHNIGVAKYISDDIAVVYAGKVVEYGKTDKVMQKPEHPYTQLLISSVPSFSNKTVASPVGDVPSLIDPPPGCKFHPRCPYVMPI